MMAKKNVKAEEGKEPVVLYPMEPMVVSDATSIRIVVEDKPVEPSAPAAPKLSEHDLNKAVRVQNVGEPFPCDLTAFGYGMRWPTKAVYIITVRRYMELLEQGFNGSYV
jgi:hypothetical protein